jgi:RimJ/RimL family protein N-acetyltransferase
VIAAQPIDTARLTLVPLAAGHADEMVAVLADPQLYAFTGGAPPSREALRGRYERWAAGSPDPAVSWCNWAIRLRSADCLTGTVQATISTHGEPVAEIAWVVGIQWQGQGIATEAARALVGWLGRQSVRTVIAHIHPRHRASAAVAAAAGLAATRQSVAGETRWELRLNNPCARLPPTAQRRPVGEHAGQPAQGHQT